jgi:hypothetical protein
MKIELAGKNAMWKKKNKDDIVLYYPKIKIPTGIPVGIY